MTGTPVPPRILERAATALRGRLVARQQYGCVALENAIELTQELKRTSGFASCEVLIAGYEQALAGLSAISPTAPPSAESLTSLIARFNLFEEFFALLAQLAVITGSLRTRVITVANPPRRGLRRAPLRSADPALAVGNQDTGRRMRPGPSIARKTRAPSICGCHGELRSPPNQHMVGHAPRSCERTL